MYDTARFSLFLLLGAIFFMHCKNHSPLRSVANFDLQGHRGARGLMPENTIPAMHKALELGVQTLEMDVVISRDNQVVVSHDPYFSALISTNPEGKYIAAADEKRYLIYQMDYAEIKSWDVGLKPHPLFPRQFKMAVHKPLLSDLIDAVEAKRVNGARSVVQYNIETKCSPAGDKVMHPEPEEFVELLMGVIKSKGIEKRTTIQSFDIRTLQVLHRKYPKMHLSLLHELKSASDLEANLEALGFTPQVYSPDYRSVMPELIRKCHGKNMQIIPWTVNDAVQIKKLREMGVDGLITDYPDLFAR